MLNKLVVLCSSVFLAITTAYATSPEQPNSVSTDTNLFQTNLNDIINNTNKGDLIAQFAFSMICVCMSVIFSKA
jgi:hypothetical protein